MFCFFIEGKKGILKITKEWSPRITIKTLSPAALGRLAQHFFTVKYSTIS